MQGADRSIRDSLQLTGQFSLWLWFSLCGLFCTREYKINVIAFQPFSLKKRLQSLEVLSNVIIIIF